MLHTKVTSSRRSVRIIILAGLIALLAPALYAQPVLRITELFPNWPHITLKYTYRCDGEWRFDIPKSSFKLFENGREVTNYSVWCPDPGDLCPLAAALVIDGSESMAGEKNERAKQAAKHFVSLMDGDMDEAALFWFNQTVTLRVPMTDITSRLYDAIDELPATNLTAAWDGAYAAINHVANFTTVPPECRAVLLLTDGKDNNSGHTLESVIAYALAEGVRVFVVGIGDDVNETALLSLAMRTNGKYFHTVDAIDLSDIFERVFMEARSLFECQLYYRADCPDGTERVVELRVENYCGTTVSATKIYNAPLDSSMFAVGNFEVGTSTTKENTVAELPVYAISLPQTGEFPAGTMTLQYDTSCIQFVSAFDSGTMLEGANLRSQPVPGGVKLEWDDTEIMQNYGTFLLTYFRTFTTDSASCCDVSISEFYFYHGCLKTRSGDGAICYFSKTPDVECSLSLPDSLSWSYAEDDYIPNPFLVTYVLKNTGDKTARNVRYTISYDPKKLTLVQPPSPTQTGKSEDLAGWESDTVSWLVKANPQGMSGRIDVCVTAHFDNRGDLECCTSTRVQQAPSTMVCSIDAPKIVAQTALERYSPMPFTVTVNVFNSGAETKDSVTATITLQDDLELLPGQASTLLVSPKLLPDSTASASWILRHPAVVDSLIIPVYVTVISTSGDTTHCETVIVIPPLNAPVLEAYCNVPSYLDLDPFTLAYSPNPFTASVTIRNVGTKAAKDVNAYLMVPEGFDILGSDGPRKLAEPPLLQPGGEVTLEWQLQYNDRKVDNQRAYCRWAVGSSTTNDIPLDTVRTECDIAVPGVPPSLLCEINAIDTLFVDQNIGLIYPNPVPVMVRVRNATVLARGLESVRARIFTGDAEFEAGTPAVRVLNTNMNPGRVVELLWYVKVKPARVEQKIVIVITVLDTEGIETTCVHTIIVPPSPLYISCAINASARVFAWQRSSGQYFPDSIVVTAVLENNSDGDLIDTPVRLEIDGEDTFIGLDPTVPGNTAERTIPLWKRDSLKSLSWVVEPLMAVQSENPEVIVFTVSYFDPERGWLRTGCIVEVVMEPVNLQHDELTCELLVPDTIRFVDSSYVPDIFSAEVRITNEGSNAANNVQVYLLLDARFSSVGPTIRTVPTIPSGATHVVTPDFQLRVTPSRKEGHDTLRVLILADEGLSTTCEIPIFIERQTDPEMFIECVSDIDTIYFDEALNSFVPDQLTLTTLIANTGDGPARAVAATVLMPPGYQILDSATVSLGTLQPADTRNLVWRVKPICEAEATLDSIRVLVRGVGGVGNQIHIDDCAIEVYKEPCAEPEVELACSLPDTIRFTGPDGTYSPYPTVMSLTVTNTSTFDHSNLAARFSALNVFTLAQGESIVKPIPLIPAGTDYTLTWEIVPTGISDTVTARVCAELLFGDNALAQCCAQSFVVPFSAADISLACSAPDSLKLSPDLRGYADVPFSYCVEVTNTGVSALTDITLELDASTGLLPVEAITRTVPGPLAPGAALPDQCWTIDVIPSENAKTLWVNVIVTANGAVTECRRNIFVPAVQKRPVTCEVALPEGDSLTSVRGDVPFPVNVTVTKADSVSWDEVSVELVLPDMLVPAAGEPLTRPGSDGVIAGNISTLTWNVVLPAIYRDAGARIRAIVSRFGEEVSQCEATAFITGVIPSVTLRLPLDMFASFGRKFAIPVIIDTIDPVVVTEMTVTVEYDPSLLRISEYAAGGTLTEVGWNVSPFDANSTPGVVTFGVLPVGSGGTLSDGSILCYLVGAPVGTERRKELTFYESPMAFLLEDYSPEIKSSAFHASVDGVTREMAVSSVDGTVYVTGDCILPLNASGGTYALANTPNPFNPDTRISFRVPEAMDVKISVYDVYGREVAVVYQDWAPEGESSVVFDASGLPAGVYFSIMETPFGALTEKMNLVK